MKHFFFKSLNIVNGYKRSLILDHKRNSFKYIPKDMSILLSSGSFNSDDLAESYDKDIVEDYRAFLIKNEFIFPERLCSALIEFSDRSTEVFRYDKISSSHFILNNDIDIERFFLRIESLREDFHCDHFSVFKDSNITENVFLDCLKGIAIIEPIYVKIDGSISSSLLSKIVELFNCFLEINNKLILDVKFLDGIPSRVLYETFSKKNSSFVPKFKFDLGHYNSALKYNSFFFQKIFFNSNLDFFSDKLFSDSNIHSTLDDSYENSHSKKTKDTILVCRDCEHRYSCYDKRVPINTSIENIYTFNEECPYNPYIAKWNTEEGHQTVAESIADGVVSEEFVYREK